MYNTSVWTPTLGNHRDGLYASVWIPTLGSRVAHGAWLSFFRMFRIEASMLMFIDCFYLCFRFSRLDLHFEMYGNMDACFQWKPCALLAFFGAFLKSSAVALKIASLKQHTLTWSWKKNTVKRTALKLLFASSTALVYDSSDRT